MSCSREYKTKELFFSIKNDEIDNYQSFTVNSDGTISFDLDPKYVIGQVPYKDEVFLVERSDENALRFENAHEILGVSDTHGIK